jgi:hypothetical protein
MKKLALILVTVFGLGSPVFAGEHCSCDQACMDRCEKGDSKACECKSCDSKDAKCDKCKSKDCDGKQCKMKKPELSQKNK